MGYSTEFYGEFFKVTPILSKAHRDYLEKFSYIRHMKRDVKKLVDVKDDFREAVGLSPGIDGEFYVGSCIDSNCGQGFPGHGRDDSILEYNYNPQSQPGLWCQWTPNEEGDTIEWDGGEKFYGPEEWLQYIIDSFIKPWGYVLNGETEWQGDDRDDMGLIIVKDNVLEIKHGKIVFE